MDLKEDRKKMSSVGNCLFVFHETFSNRIDFPLKAAFCHLVSLWLYDTTGPFYWNSQVFTLPIFRSKSAPDTRINRMFTIVHESRFSTLISSDALWDTLKLTWRIWRKLNGHGEAARVNPANLT